MNIIFKIRLFISRQIIDIKTYGIRELFRKFLLLIKVLAIIPPYIIAIVPCIIIRLIRPWIIIRIERIPVTNYGNFVLDPAIYYCKKKLKIEQPTKKHIDLFYIPFSKKIYNKQLAKMWIRKLNFLPGYLLNPIDNVNKLIPGWKDHSIEFFPNVHTHIGGIFMHDSDYLIKKCQPLDFTNEEEIYGKRMLNKFGLKDGDKFVCLAVRDDEFEKKKIPPRFRSWSYHNYRNVNIDNFVLAAEELARRGYYVFRMGVVVNKPFNSNNPKIIDYANLNLRNDFMDVYFGAKCSFCITTGLGFDEMPYIFRKPIVSMCSPVGDFRTHSEQFLYLAKHHVLKKEKRKLTLSEIFSYGLAHAYDTKIFEQKGIALVDNTPEEIKDIVIEMVENLEFKKKPNPKDEELQETFKSLFSSNIKRVIQHALVKNTNHKLPGPFRARFGTKFLRENENWLR